MNTIMRFEDKVAIKQDMLFEHHKQKQAMNNK